MPIVMLENNCFKKMTNICICRDTHLSSRLTSFSLNLACKGLLVFCGVNEAISVSHFKFPTIPHVLSGLVDRASNFQGIKQDKGKFCRYVPLFH